MPGTKLSFSVVKTESEPLLITPEGDSVAEPWWNEASKPDSRIPIDRVNGLITQIDETGGKQSCFLTAQLNALILREALSTQEAAWLQATFATDNAFSKYWRDQAAFGRDYVAWSSRPHDTAYAISSLNGQRMAMTVKTVEEPEVLNQLLDDGYALIIGDERHSRTVFKPEGSELPFVFDSKYSEAIGFYEPSSLQRLQTDPYVVVI